VPGAGPLRSVPSGLEAGEDAVVRGWIGGVAALALLAVAACAQDAAISRAQTRSETGDLEGAATELEAARDRDPDSVDVHIALGAAYYRIARDALDREHDEARYLSYLEKANVEIVTALELDPRNPHPHFYLAVMDTYRGNLHQALRGFNNARRLEPQGIAYTNIAEIYVYLGQVHKAQRWNDLGMQKGAPYGAGLFNDMLIAWKQGNLADARQCFAELRATDPEWLRTINDARLPQMPRDFDDFAEYCCSSPACGPYMENACKALSLEVSQREISKEAMLKELRIEMETKRRLKKVYEQRKELEIQIDEEPQGN
jgi:tetratricopeptide (TPR) repeat protein